MLSKTLLAMQFHPPVRFLPRYAVSVSLDRYSLCVNTEIVIHIIRANPATNKATSQR